MCVCVCVCVLVGRCWLVGWVGFYGISTFVGYLTPNLFYENSSISNNSNNSI